MMFKAAHGTERGNRIKDFKVLLDSKGLIKSLRAMVTIWLPIIGRLNIFSTERVNLNVNKYLG